MQTLDMVNQNCELASTDSGFSKTEWEELGKAMENLKKYCGMCEKKCPQHLKIRDELKIVEALFK